MIGALWHDLRFAVRSLSRRPIVTTAVVLSLALGIGVNTAIFSVFDRFVLRRLTVPAPQDLVLITSPGPHPGGASTGDSGGTAQVFSYPLFRDLEAIQTTTMSRIAAHRDFAANVAIGGQTMRTNGLVVSGSYFPVLGISPALGRLLTPADDLDGNPDAAVVLGHAFWSTRLGADPAIVGRTVVINATAMTIVGVAPPGFSGTTLLDAPDLFVPLAMSQRLHTGGQQRDNHWLYLFARLTTGVSRDQAAAALSGPFTSLLRDVEYPALAGHLDDGARQQFLSRRIVLEDGARYRAANRDQAGVLLGLLLAVTGLVLLIACANVANLLLARVADRAAEIRVRLAIGASSAGLVRLLLVESILLGLLGAAAAVGVAGGTMAALLRLLPASDATLLQFEVNRQILLFTLALGIGSGLLFGLLPAWHGVRAAAVAGLAASTGRASATRRAARARTSLVTAQIALATVLLAQAGLFTTSLRNVSREDIGVRRAGLITFRLSPYLNGYTGEQTRQFFDRLTEQLRRTPGVTGVSVSTNALLSDDAGWRQNVTVEGVDDRPAAVGSVSATRIGEDYFRTLGIALQAGREFAVADTAATPQVAIVNQAFARQFHLNGQVVGRRLALGGGNASVPDIEVVGLVADAKYGRVHEAAPAQLFLAARQAPVGPLTFFARSNDPRSLLSSVPAAVASLDPNLPVERLRTLDDQIWDNVTGDRVIATLSAAFAVLALLLAAIGLYAVLAYTVAQRLKEIGIRMALGASIGQVRQLIVGQVSRIALVGVVAGTALAAGTGRLGQALLFGLSADDPSVLGGAAALVIVVVAVATFNPARRATSVQPAAALRAE